MFLLCLPLSIGKSNLSLCAQYNVEAYNELEMPFYTSFCPGNTTPSEEMLPLWETIGNTAFNLAGLRFDLNLGLLLKETNALPLDTDYVRTIYSVMIII